MRTIVWVCLVGLSGCGGDDDGSGDTPPCDLQTVCVHVRDGEVPLEECRIGQTPGDNLAIDPRSIDGMLQYFDTQDDYREVEACPQAPSEQTCVCLHARDGEVPLEECAIGDTPGENLMVDPRSPSGAQYFNTRDDYAEMCD
jgi:hypothetical protein